MPSQTGCTPGTAGRPFYSYRPTLGRYRGWTQIHEGLPTDEDVQRSFNKSCTLQEIKKQNRRAHIPYYIRGMALFFHLILYIEEKNDEN